MSGKKRPATNNIKIIKNGTTLSGKDLAESLNAYFLSVSNDLPPLNSLLLPAFLPAPKPVSKIFPDEVCTKMLNTKVLKSSGPDNIPNRIIKDFAYELAEWICSFLSNRRQSVKIDNFQSDWGINNAGVPQGTKLGPILFIIMINDLELASSSTDHWKYVDDVTISESLKKNEVSVLQSDLNSIERWSVNNNMKLNGKKCKEMMVSFARSENDIPRLLIDGLPLDLVSSFKILGLTMNNKLNWQDNTKALVKKASKRLYIIRVLQRCGLSSNDLLLVYFSMCALS